MEKKKEMKLDGEGILTKKRCGIILIAACFIYFIFNIVIWTMDFVPAITGAICSMFVLGLFLYFTREITKKKTRIRLGSDIDPEICERLGGEMIDGQCTLIQTGIGDEEDVHIKLLKKR